MELQGKIKVINEVQEVTTSFKKREFVLTTQEQYPQDILLEVTQDKVDLLNEFKEGEDVEVSINIRGKEWINPEGIARYFNTIQAWRIKKTNNQSITNTSNQGAESDSLPF